MCGPDFGSGEIVSNTIVKRVFYGMKASGRDFRNHMRYSLDNLRYMLCKSNPDLWVILSNHDSGSEECDYMLLYVYDCPCISQYPDKSLYRLGEYFILNPGSVGPPSIYLGGKLSQV